MGIRRASIRHAFQFTVSRAEHDQIVAALQRRIDELTEERDAVSQGFEMLTQALRRHGCCDRNDAAGHTN